MKTTISVPDETFSRASKRAAELGMSRSEFFTRAAQQYLEPLDAASVTEQIDRALAVAGDDDFIQRSRSIAGGCLGAGAPDGWHPR